MFKIDTHVHTVETSSCARIEAKETVRLYKESGYQGVIITDHYYDYYFNNLIGLSWDEKIDQFLRGYHHATEEGSKLGLKVFLGLEIRFTENPNDYLVYGITEQFLKEHRELYTLGLTGFKKLIEKEDILIIQAHPFRKHMIVASPEDIHGVEIYNGNCRHDSHNELSLAYAKKHSLMMSSGSDFHELEDLARGGMVFEQEVNTNTDFVNALRDKSALELLSTK
ncbi:MAG: transposase [Herbinix sp.]|jgi:predicted metal-dependent phosphoesterase TrpH|nr:transposase [Herbinix sp.]